MKEKEKLEQLRTKVFRLKLLQIAECLPFGVGSTVAITNVVGWAITGDAMLSIPETAAYAALGITSYAVLQYTTDKYNQTLKDIKELEEANDHNKKL